MSKREKPIRYASYGRTSSEQQDVENSLAGQRSAAEAYVGTHGGVLVEHYLDEAKSGRVDSRPEFQRMVKDATSDNPPFDVLVVWKLNRFARNVRDMMRYWDLLEEHGIQVISIMEPFLEGPLGQLMRVIIAGFDEFFSENMASDIKRGMKEVVERGFYLGNPGPVGYKIVKVEDGAKMRNKLELDQPWDALARHVWELALADLTMLDIARELEKEGYRTRLGSKITKGWVHKLLTNETYTGFTVWDVDETTGIPAAKSFVQAHPAIVSKAEFDRVHNKLKSRAPNIKHPRSAANDHLFNDLARCGQCGAKMKIKSGKGGAYFYFVCQTRDDSGAETCNLPNYSVEKNDPIIMGAIADDILTAENLKDLIAIVLASAGPTTREQQRQLDNIDEQIRRLNEREDRMMERLGSVNISIDKFNAQIDSLHQQMEEQEAKREEITSLMGDEAQILDDPDLIVNYAKDIRTYLQEGSVKAVNTICGRFIRTIWFEPGCATIEYSIPIPDGTSEPRAKATKVALKSRVRSTVQTGSGGWTRTNDLRVMSPTSCHCSTPQRRDELNRKFETG